MIPDELGLITDLSSYTYIVTKAHALQANPHSRRIETPQMSDLNTHDYYSRDTGAHVQTLRSGTSRPDQG